MKKKGNSYQTRHWLWTKHFSITDPRKDITKSHEDKVRMYNWLQALHGSLDADNQARYHVYQLELTEDEKIHAQGYSEFYAPMRMKRVKGHLEGADFVDGPKGDVHVEPRRGTREQARHYCMKSKSRMTKPFAASLGIDPAAIGPHEIGEFPLEALKRQTEKWIARDAEIKACLRDNELDECLKLAEAGVLDLTHLDKMRLQLYVLNKPKPADVKLLESLRVKREDAQLAADLDREQRRMRGVPTVRVTRSGREF